MLKTHFSSFPVHEKNCSNLGLQPSGKQPFDTKAFPRPFERPETKRRLITSFLNACGDSEQLSSALPCWQFFSEITAAHTRFHHLRSEIQNTGSGALSIDSSRVNVRDQISVGV